MDNDILKNVWPEWNIVRLIGRGSYGSVYEAERSDSHIYSRSAIKVISIPQNAGEVDSLRAEGMTELGTRTYFKNMVEDFVSEISMMESLKGVQNIVSVEDYKVIEKTDEIGWNIYIRMELLIPFNTFVQRNGIDEETIIKLGTDISTAIELCSRKNVIHRDIKPENIFVNSFGDFKLGDFGIARRLESASSNLSQKGTYQYMAPEVQSGDRYDGTVDIYSLGLVLYKLANKNRLPFMDTEKEVITPNDKVNATRRRFSGERLPAPCGVSEGLGNIILKACEFEPRNRFQDAGEMKRAFKALQDGVVPRYENPEITEDNVDKTVGVRRAFKAYENDDIYTGTQTLDGQSINGGNIPPQRPERPNDSKKKFLIIALIALAAAVVIAAAIIFLPNLFNKEEEKTVKETETTAEITTEAETTAEITTEPETTAQTSAAEETSVTTQTTASSELGTGSNVATRASNAMDNANTPTGSGSDSEAYSINSGVVNITTIGQVVTFGTYEQDGNASNGAESIEWEVIYQENGNYLLISKYALDAQPYNSVDTSNVSWETCSLRSWLNNSFYYTAFSSTDRSRIAQSAKTGDYVSLLGYDETGNSGVTYFMASVSARSCYATTYAINQGAWVTNSNGYSPWWLRNTVSGSDTAYMVKSTGEIGSNVVSNGTSASDISGHTLVTVRPIIWIKSE